MKRIYDSGRRPAARNYTIADLLVVWDEHIEHTRRFARLGPDGG